MSQMVSESTQSLFDHEFRYLMDHMDDGVFFVDVRERIVYTNPSLTRMFSCELDLEKATVTSLASTIMPDPNERRVLLELVRRLLVPALQDKMRLDEMVIETADGVVKFVEFELLPLHDERRRGVLAIVHDATRRIKAQRDLETLLRSTSDGILVFGQDRQITVFNDALERLTGFRREEVLYQSDGFERLFDCGEHTGIPAVLFEGAEYSAALAPVQSLEQVIKTKNGRRRWVDISYSPINDPSGRPAYIICIIRDVHEKRQLLAHMQIHHKLATLGELVAGLAHEIRNPLGIISSAADVVANEERPAPQRREAARFIQDEVQTLGRTMDALLGLSTPSRVEDSPVDVNGVLQRLLGFYLPQRDNLRIQTSYAENLPRVRASRDALQTVFLNLIMNADQAMPDGGEIEIRTERNGKNARITVTDDGVGIAAEHADKIFDPFFTTKTDGTGLGLALVAHVVKAHGGSVTVENSPDKGAIFTIDLPGVDQEE